MKALNKKMPSRMTRKLTALCRDAALDLTGMHVYTEAATGAYASAAAIALLSSADHVHCAARRSAYGTVDQAFQETRDLAAGLGLDTGRISFSEGHDAGKLARADLVTNSAPLRPLDADVLRHMKKSSVISLMYEPWEFRSSDLDCEAARAGEIWVVGVNETNPVVNCFPSAGALALKGLFDAGLEVFANDLLVVCANRFAPYVMGSLAQLARSVDVLDEGEAGSRLPEGVKRLKKAAVNGRHYDALVMMDLPEEGKWNISRENDSLWPLSSLGTWDACVQVMGDIRRDDFPGVNFFPEKIPARGCMGLNPGFLGMDLVFRNLVAGFSAGAEALRALARFGSIREAEAKRREYQWIRIFSERSGT